MRRKVVSSETAIEVEFPHILEDLIGDLAWSPQPIEIKVRHDDEATYKQVAKEIEEWLPKVKGVVDIANRTIVIGPSNNFRVDPEKARLAGFGVKDVADLQAAMLDGEVASDLIRGERLVGIRVRYPAEYRSSTAKLKSLLLTSPTGQTVPMSSIATVEVDEGTTEIRRENLRNMSAVTARLEKRDLWLCDPGNPTAVAYRDSTPSGHTHRVRRTL